MRIAFVVHSLTVVDYSLKASYNKTIDMTIVIRFIKWIWGSLKEPDVNLISLQIVSFASGSAV